MLIPSKVTVVFPPGYPVIIDETNNLCSGIPAAIEDCVKLWRKHIELSGDISFKVAEYEYEDLIVKIET